MRYYGTIRYQCDARLHQYLCIHISCSIDVLITMDYLVILYPNYSVVQTICTTTIQVSQEEHDQDKAGDAIGEPYPQLGLETR
jgi:hypothetical protein